jgi:hypothetical protein
MKIIKTNSNGDTIWTKKYLNMAPTSVCEVTDGYLITGFEQEMVASGTLFKTSLSGDSIVMKTLLYGGDDGFLGHWHGYINSSIITGEGDCLMGGSRFGYVRGSLVEIRGYLFLYNSNGDSLWKNEIEMGDWVSINSAIQTSENYYLAAGTYNKSSPELTKVFLAKVIPPLTDLRKSGDIFINNYSLSQNYPNPFNPITTIEFDLPKTSDVILKVFNILGEEVATLVSDRLTADSYSYEWDASNLASGVYLYRLQAGEYVAARKMMLLR